MSSEYIISNTLPKRTIIYWSWLTWFELRGRDSSNQSHDSGRIWDVMGMLIWLFVSFRWVFFHVFGYLFSARHTFYLYLPYILGQKNFPILCT
ncbi:hypothetical protein BDZ91DRAFT_709082, partial [Kalaharituber pfeilii]